jgi:hypothetical protein
VCTQQSAGVEDRDGCYHLRARLASGWPSTGVPLLVTSRASADRADSSLESGSSGAAAENNPRGVMDHGLWLCSASSSDACAAVGLHEPMTVGIPSICGGPRSAPGQYEESSLHGDSSQPQSNLKMPFVSFFSRQ